MLVKRLHTLIRNPDESFSWVKRNLDTLGRRLRARQFTEAGDSIIGLTIGWDTYIDYLKHKHDAEPIVRQVVNSKMAIDLSDPGISQTLFIHGIRELESTEVFSEQLRSLQTVTDTATVLDIGANIGYYILIEGDILGTGGHILAFEPSPRNVEMLERNISLNGYADLVDVFQVAVGPKSGTSNLSITSRSNTHHIATATQESTSADTINVETVNILEHLDEKQIQPDEVNVIRMDIEGFEYEILPTFEPIVTGNQPLVVFIEFHADNMNSDILGRALEMFLENDCEIISVVDYYDGQLDVDSSTDLEQLDNFELIVSRGV